MPAQQPAPREATDDELVWLEVLLELEAELEQSAVIDSEDYSEGAEQGASDAAHAPFVGSGMWRAPAQMPPMPETLRERAEALHRAQLEREQELRAERNQVLKHIEALSVVPRPRSATASVYLDVSG